MSVLHKLICFLLLAMFFSGCAHKRFFKEAQRYETAGLYGLAADKYMTSLSKKSNYLDARIGLMRSATRYASELTQKE